MNVRNSSSDAGGRLAWSKVLLKDFNMLLFQYAPMGLGSGLAFLLWGLKRQNFFNATFGSGLNKTAHD